MMYTPQSISAGDAPKIIICVYLTDDDLVYTKKV